MRTVERLSCSQKAVTALVLPDVFECGLHCHRIQGCDGQAEELLDASVQYQRHLMKPLAFFFRRALESRGVCHAPMGRHRLPWPHGTDFPSGVIAHGKEKIELR